MGTHSRSGFTIIETMLVLAVTGALVVGVFIGIGSSLSVQRYRDSVDTLKSTLQNQYAELASVQNNRSNSWSCNPAAQTNQGASEVRGQSDCVVLGRLVTINATDMKIYSVLGNEIASPSGSANDIQVMRDDYTLNTSSVVVDSSKLEWGTQISWPESGAGARTPTTPRQIAILFIRSPTSGQVYTFSSDSAPTNPNSGFLRSMIVAGTPPIGGQSNRVICVKESGLGTSEAYLLRINEYAAVPNAIETSTNQLLQQSGVSTRC